MNLLVTFMALFLRFTVVFQFVLRATVPVMLWVGCVIYPFIHLLIYSFIHLAIICIILFVNYIWLKRNQLGNGSPVIGWGILMDFGKFPLFFIIMKPLTILGDSSGILVGSRWFEGMGNAMRASFVGNSLQLAAVGESWHVAHIQFLQLQLFTYCTAYRLLFTFAENRKLYRRFRHSMKEDHLDSLGSMIWRFFVFCWFRLLLGASSWFSYSTSLISLWRFYDYFSAGFDNNPQPSSTYSSSYSGGWFFFCSSGGWENNYWNIHQLSCLFFVLVLVLVLFSSSFFIIIIIIIFISLLLAEACSGAAPEGPWGCLGINRLKLTGEKMKMEKKNRSKIENWEIRKSSFQPPSNLDFLSVNWIILKCNHISVALDYLLIK